MNPAAVANILMALMPLINTGTEHLIKAIEAHRQAAMQTGEWTDEYEATYQKTLLVYGPEHLPDSAQ